jgi:RNA polymerase sigma factor for flagellar operon FliA
VGAQSGTETPEAALWQAWRERGDAAARDALIGLHQDFARIMAGKLYAQRYTDEIEFDEYLQFARVGLLESIDRYDPAHGASFRTFSAHRMQGAVLSGLECLTECNRQVALRKRLEQERTNSLAERDPDAPVDSFEHLVAVAVGLAVGYMLEDFGSYQALDSSYGDSAYTELADRQTRNRLHALMERLPAREARIIRHHYLQQVPFDEIARQMELTPGRVSQLHKRALEQLRGLLQAERLDFVV